MTVLHAHAAPARTGPLGKPIGIQLYTVKTEAAKDLEGTLAALAKVGYREIELPGGPSARPVAEMRKLLNGFGLTCPSVHASMTELQATPQEKIDMVRALGGQYLVCSYPWTADSRFSTSRGNMAQQMTLDDWKWNAEQLNRLGELAKRAGVRIGYHNHNMEFRSYDGVVAFDELIRLTDPALVTIELDIGWVVTGGADPLHYLRNHAARIELLHVKEVRKDLKVGIDTGSQTTELGRGLIDWPKLFAAMDGKRIRHYFVEQENFEGSPLDAVKVDFEYMQRLGASV